MTSRTIYLVDDHPLTRAGLRLTLEGGLGARVCGEAAGVEEAAAGIGRLARRDAAPALVVVDITLAGGSGLDLVRRLGAGGPPTLVVTMHDPEVYAARAREAGASGFVAKSSDDGELLRAARAVLDGRTHFPDVGGDAPPAGGVDALSDRELEVFELLGKGYAPRHIAEALALSVSTVEAYRQRVCWKLGVPSSSLLARHAVAWALERGGRLARPAR